MTATADLRSEHVGVGRMLGIMDAMARRAKEGEKPDLGDLAQVIEFLRVFVDRCHHAKEEDLLFPAMRAADLVSAEPTIEILLDDHVQGRATVARIAAATQAIGEGSESAVQELADSFSDYTRLLHAHIRREENDCFNVADRELSSFAQQELAEGYDRIERDVVGEGVHESFHALLDRLSEAYR